MRCPYEQVSEIRSEELGCEVKLRQRLRCENGNTPSLRNILGDIEWSSSLLQFEACFFCHVNVFVHCAQLREQHAVFDWFDVVLDLLRCEFGSAEPVCYHEERGSRRVRLGCVKKRVRGREE